MFANEIGGRHFSTSAAAQAATDEAASNTSETDHKTKSGGFFRAAFDKLRGKSDNDKPSDQQKEADDKNKN
jgi:hypothetical protein